MVAPISFGSGNVLALCRFVSAAEQDKKAFACFAEIDSVSRAGSLFQFIDTISEAAPFSQVAKRQAIQALKDLCNCA